MLSRKMILLCMVAGTLCFVSACTSEKNAETGKEVSKEENGKELKQTEKELEITEDFKYLYHEALEGEQIETEIETSRQKEYKVEKGEFVKRISEIGIIQYEDLYDQHIITNEAKDMEFHVTEGQEVKKGDLIATYTPVFNKIDILEETRDVELMEKEYQAEYNSKLAAINMAEHELKLLRSEKKTNKKEIEIKELQIKKLKLTLEEFKKTKKPIEEARKELDEWIAGNDVNSVYASTDGYVHSMPEVSSGDGEQMFYKGDWIITITKREKYYLTVETREELDSLKYGTVVKIVVEGGKDGKNVEMKGKVVSAPNILGSENYMASTNIEIIDEPADVDWSKPIKVQYESQLYENALKIPIEAVMTEKTLYDDVEVDGETEYVFIKNGDAIYKSYINVLDKNNDYYRVSSGVSEGDTLVCFNK